MWFLLFARLALAAPPLALPAGVDLWEHAPGPAGEPEHVSIELEDADIRSVLRLFAELGQLNFVIGEEVKGTITARLIDVRWDEALAALLLAKGLAAEPIGPILKISPIGGR